MPRRLVVILISTICALTPEPGATQQKSKIPAPTKTAPKRCFIRAEDIISKLTVNSRPTEHYHKVKGFYTWQETVYIPVELEGSGDIEVRCE